MIKKISKLFQKVPQAIWLIGLPVVLLLALALSPLEVPKNEQIVVEGVIEIGTKPYFTEVAGKVVEVKVNLGQKVVAGDTLVVLESQAAQNRVAELETSVIKMQLLLDELEKGAPYSDKLIAAHEVEQARQRMYNAHAEYLLSINVHEKSRDKVDDMAMDRLRIDMDNKGRLFRIAELQFFAAEEGPKKLSASNNPEQIASTKADLEFLQDQLAQAKTDLEKTTIKATADGIVVIKNAEEGGLVSAGEKLVEVSLEAEKTAVFWVPEEYLGEVAYGQSMRVSNKVVNAQKETAGDYSGEVNYIDMSAQYTPKEAANATNQNKLSFKVKVFLGEEPQLRVAQKMLLKLGE